MEPPGIALLHDIQNNEHSFGDITAAVLNIKLELPSNQVLHGTQISEKSLDALCSNASEDEDSFEVEAKEHDFICTAKNRSKQQPGASASVLVAEPLATQSKATRRSPAWSESGLLPEFSVGVQQLLMGAPLPEAILGNLRRQMRQELISFLDDRNLLQEGSSGTLRWQYNDLGKCLATKYPKLLWDPPREGGERRVEVWSTFMRRLSATRRSRRKTLKGDRSTDSP